MCICKRSSTKNTTTRRTINKTMAPPPPQATRRFKGMPPSAPDHTTVTVSSPAAGSPTLSTSQLSAVLDPFFTDTFDFLREASAAVQRQQPTPAAAATSTVHANAHHQRIEHVFLSGPAVAGDAAALARYEAKMASNPDTGASALDSFAVMSSAAWMGAVEDMEAEKNDMLRLEVRASSC